MKNARLIWVGLSAVILLAATQLPAAFDETYYWTWGKAPALSYLDHPPAFAWILAATTFVFGDGLLGTRVSSVVSMVVLVFAHRAAAGRLASDAARARMFSTLTLFGSLMFTVGYLPGTPDPVQGALLGVAALCVVRSFEANASLRWAFGAGFLLVALVLVKHSSALVAGGALLGALATPHGRRLLSRPAPWLGVAAGGLVLLPWLLHDLGDPSGATAFQAARVFEAVPRGPMGIALTAGALLVALGPAAAIAIVACVPSSRSGNGAAAVLAGGALALIIGCAVAAWLGTGEVNWVMPALAFGAPAAIAWVLERPRVARGYGWLTAGSTVVSLLVLIHVISPFAPIEPMSDRTLRSAGFQEIALRAEEVAKAHGADALITRRYQIAGQLRFQLSDRVPVFELGTGRRSQFDLWPHPTLCAGRTAVLVVGRSDLPRDFPVGALPDAPRVEVMRSRGKRELDRWYITPVRMLASTDPAACGRLASAVPGGAP